MKKNLHILLGILLTSTLSFSASLEDFRTDYNTAIATYNAQNYSKAYQLFYALLEIAPTNTEINFYLGRSALELKKYDDAMAAFDRVLILNPTHTRTKLELARLYFETSQYELAQNELDTILQEKLPQSVHETVLNFKKSIDAQREKHTFGGALILTLDYDSNIGNDVGRGVTQNLLNIIDLPGNNQRKSAGLSQTLLFNHVYDFGEKGSWAWENNFVMYNKNMTHYSDKDLLLASLTSGPTLSIDTYKLSVFAAYDRIRLGSEDYLGTSSFSLNLKKIISPTLLLETDVTKKRNINVNDTSTSDSDSLIYTLGMKKSLGESPWIVGLYIAYQDDNERAKDAVQYGISLDQWSYKTEISKELTKNIRGTIGYAYKDIHYNEYDALFNLKRKDNENYYVLGLSYAIDKQSSIILQYAYTDHNSNNALYAYTKNLTSLSYMRSF